MPANHDAPFGSGIVLKLSSLRIDVIRIASELEKVSSHCDTSAPAVTPGEGKMPRLALDQRDLGQRPIVRMKAPSSVHNAVTLSPCMLKSIR